MRIYNCYFCGKKFNIPIYSCNIAACSKCSNIRKILNHDENCRTNNGSPDKCLSWLPGVHAACCGHGKKGFILFNNGTMITMNIVEIQRRNSSVFKEFLKQATLENGEIINGKI